jgi:hypothetical protein
MRYYEITFFLDKEKHGQLRAHYSFGTEAIHINTSEHSHIHPAVTFLNASIEDVLSLRNSLDAILVKHFSSNIERKEVA